MVKRITPSQLRSKLRQIESKQRQAVQRHNQAVRKYNQEVKRAVDQHNREVRQHNGRVRANRQKVLSQLSQLRSSSSTARYQSLRTSAITLHERYNSLESSEQDFAGRQFGPAFLDLSERENANSLEVSNVLESDDEDSAQVDPALLGRSEVSLQLNAISPELENRWRGALFSLNPNNPDAARHFCTSAREVFVQMLDLHAPDGEVLAHDPHCEKTERGVPTRKAKIKYLLVRAGVYTETAVDFVDEDVKNVLQLFRVFNDGTHGSSGRFALGKR
jgi:phage-related tail protein